MPRPLSPQARFLARSTVGFVVLLALWWLVLRPPLLWWCRMATDVVLAAMPGAPLRTGVTVAGDLWVVQMPVRVAGVWRNVRVETGSRLPTQLTVAVPLFWAILIAAGRFRRDWIAWAAGTLVLLSIPPVGLILYATHVIQMYAFPNTGSLLRATISLADYIGSTVLPYAGPVLTALGFHPEFRRRVLG